MFKQYQFRNYNIRLVIFVIALSIMGILVVGSANENYQLRQLVGLILGLIVMAAASLFDYNWVLRFQWVFYVVIVGFLVATKLWGVDVNGSKRWLEIPVIDFQFQPSELAKIIIILFFAKFLADRIDDMKKNRTVLLALLLVAPILFLILDQPDLSTTIAASLVFCSLIFVAGISYKWVLGVLAVLVPSVAVLIYLILTENPILLEGYQANRILAWLYPDRYPDISRQQQNSIMAIGSGQLTGKGLDNNVVASVKNGNFLSEPQTDFIFAIAGEELGFIGCCLMVILIFLIVFELLNMARKARDMSGALICTGLAALIGFQSFLNISVATGLIPNTGLPLPFVSYGLTSLVSLYLGVGIALNVGLQQSSYGNYRRD